MGTLVRATRANRGRNPEPAASLAPNQNAAERGNRAADQRARSAENQGAGLDAAPPPREPSPSAVAASPDAAPPLRDPSPSAAAASPDAALHPREGRDPSPSAAAASPDAAPSSANAKKCKITQQEIEI